MKQRMRIISLATMFVFVASLLHMPPLAQNSPAQYSIQITDTKYNSQSYSIKGNVQGVTEETNLVLSVTKNGDAYYTKDFVSRSDGSFDISFDVDSASDFVDDVYSCIISEAPRTASTAVIREDDFSSSKSYVAKGNTSSTEGNPAPSMALNAEKPRLLYQSSGITKDDDGIYTVSVDVRIEKDSSIDKQIFAVSNGSGNASGVNTNINTLGYSGKNAVEIRAVNGKLKAKYASSNSNQSQITTTEISSYTKQQWFNIKAEFCPVSLELKLFIDNIRVLSDVSLYALAQNNFNRIFDTGGDDSPTDMYLDNLVVKKTSFSKVFGIIPDSTSFTAYSRKSQDDAVARVNSASEAEVIDTITSDADILGIDVSNLRGLSYGELADVASYIKSDTYSSVSQIKQAYDYISVYIDVITSSEAELSQKLELYTDELGLPEDNLYYNDNDIISGIYTHLGNVSSPEELVKMLEGYSVIYDIQRIDYEILGIRFSYLNNYGLRGNYEILAPAERSLIFDGISDFIFDFTLDYESIIRAWSGKMNLLYDECIIASFDYITSITHTDVIENKLFIEGVVTPAVVYNFKAEIYEGDTVVASCGFVTKEDGSYSCEMLLPLKTQNTAYRICVSPQEPEPQYKYYFYDTFTTGERIGNYIVDKELYVTPYNGRPSPSVCVAREEGEERPRLLAGSGSVRDMKENNILYIEADIMKGQKAASQKLWSVTDYNGNKEAFTVKATANDIVLYYKDSVLGYTTSTLIENFGLVKWYNIKFAVTMGSAEKPVTVYVDGKEVLSFTLSSTIPDIGRFLDSEALVVNGDIHYIDNIKCYIDTSFRIKASEASCDVNVSGSDRIDEAIAALNGADASGYIDVIRIYNDVFGIDISVMDILDDTTAADINITSVDYSDVASVRNKFYAECRLQQIKEAQSSQKINLLNSYESLFDIQVDVSDEEYAKFLIENIAAASKSEDVKKMDADMKLGRALKNATQMTMRDTIDANSKALQTFGMSAAYTSLTSSQRNSAALTLLSQLPLSYNINEFVNKCVEIINKASAQIGTTPNPPSPSGTSTSASVGSASVTPSSDMALPNGSFTDVPYAHWSFEAVEHLATKGIISGMGDGTFAPEKNVTREEFVKMVLTALNQKPHTYEKKFADVNPDAWYAGYVITASKLGIAQGKSDTQFGIGESIVRQDAAVILYRCLDKLSPDCIPIREAFEFSDDAAISDYAKDAVYHLHKCNVINGINVNTFAPLEFLTRAQAAKLIYGIIK